MSEDEKPAKKQGGRAAAAKPKKKKSESEESEEEEKPVNKKPVAEVGKAKPKKKPESDESDDDKPKKKKKRKMCMFGKKCYRKNSDHFTTFCHPGDESYVEESEEEQMDLSFSPTNKRKPQREATLRAKDKISVLHEASDDDGEANTYDYNDSFLDDEGKATVESSLGQDSGSDYSEDEDVQRLVKEAKGFVKNKKLVKPANKV
eukprot:GHVU01172306.1.p1 GENE.GHVU01172306.1~~GHVU01172306.1.p1  ORF type:complete len:204 (+),score=53.85 GHVU01172306.1:291-902(+)